VSGADWQFTNYDFQVLDQQCSFVFATTWGNLSATIVEDDVSKGTASENEVLTWQKNTTYSALVHVVITIDSVVFDHYYRNENETTVAFSVTNEFLQISDTQAHFTCTTNKDRDLVKVYLLLNGSYISFPGGLQYTYPGSILFSRPIYGFYNFTRIYEYNSANTTNQDYITITSNAEMVNFLPSGFLQSEDYITVAWNTNKGTGTLSVYDNSSLIATSSTEGVFIFQKSNVVGFHDIDFIVSVESKTFSYSANYTIAEWTAIVVLSGDSRINVGSLASITVTVTRDDEATFTGTVTINNKNVTVVAGTGTYTLLSDDVTSYSLYASAVYDGTGTSRGFVTNTLTLVYDKLKVEMSKSTISAIAGTAITITVNISSMYDSSRPTLYQYSVYYKMNLGEYVYLETVVNRNYFTFTPPTDGICEIKIMYAKDNSESITVSNSLPISFQVKGKPVDPADFLGTVFALGGLGVMILLSIDRMKLKRAKDRLETADNFIKKNRY
ncbi:MAG: hypothetical protein ACTSUW_02385, partial [Candidatus Heimdallarchaeota archaeon]